MIAWTLFLAKAGIASWLIAGGYSEAECHAAKALAKQQDKTITAMCLPGPAATQPK